MTDVKTTRTGRGFTHAEPINGAYGGEVTVHESSSAEYSRLWLTVTEPLDLNAHVAGVKDVPVKEAASHLDIRDAWRLAETLRHLVRNHYHHRGVRDDVTEVGRRFRPAFLQAIAALEDYGYDDEAIHIKLAPRSFGVWAVSIMHVETDADETVTRIFGRRRAHRFAEQLAKLTGLEFFYPGRVDHDEDDEYGWHED